MSQLPPEIRKACLILGISHENLSREKILESWKRQIIEVHPEKGGDHEAAIYLNTAKETLVKWLRDRGDDPPPGPLPIGRKPWT